MLRVDNLTLRRGARVLFEHASLNVHPGQKVGLVGANGSGKSSLVALVRGELHADAGEVDVPPRWVLSHVAQETPAVERAALEFVIDGDAELRAVEEAIASAEEAAHHPDPLPSEPGHAGERLAELHARYGEIGGYPARAPAPTPPARRGLSQGDPARA